MDKDDILVWWHDVAQENHLVSEPYSSTFSFLHKDRSLRTISPINLFDTIDEAFGDTPPDFLESKKKRN